MTLSVNTFHDLVFRDVSFAFSCPRKSRAKRGETRAQRGVSTKRSNGIKKACSSSVYLPFVFFIFSYQNSNGLWKKFFLARIFTHPWKYLNVRVFACCPLSKPCPSVHDFPLHPTPRKLLLLSQFAMPGVYYLRYGRFWSILLGFFLEISVTQHLKKNEELFCMKPLKGPQKYHSTQSLQQNHGISEYLVWQTDGEKIVDSKLNRVEERKPFLKQSII